MEDEDVSSKHNLHLASTPQTYLKSPDGLKKREIPILYQLARLKCCLQVSHETRQHSDEGGGLL